MISLAYIVWNPNPNVFDLGFFALKWYSLFFALAFVTSYVILKKRFAKLGKPVELLDKLTIYIAVGTLAGARLGHCLFYDFDYYRHHLLEIILPVQFKPSFKVVGFQGLASHGGAVGILAAIYFFHKKYNVSYLWTADQLALVVPLAGFFIRMGNLMNSEIIGTPTDVPWAFVFIKDDMLPRHPSQLYEALAYLIIFLIINNLKPKKVYRQGFTFGWMLYLIFSVRLIIEFFKEDQSAFEYGWVLNMGQILSIPLIIGGFTLIIISIKKA